MRTQDILKKIAGKLAVSGFAFWEKFGIHIIPDKFDSPIPSTRELSDDIFQKKSDCVGIDWNEGEQENYLRNVFPEYATEVEFKKNEGLSLVDAAIYHAMIRKKNQKRL